MTKTETENQQQTLNYLAQGFYLKDFSFESPKAPAIFTQNMQKPAMELAIDVGVQKLENNNFEVSLRTNAQASVDSEVIFLIELLYAGAFAVNTELSKDEIERILLVDCARDIFPFSRRFIADTTREGGFAPLILNPVDFETVYKARKK
jgi:preprotein translocase subunit SecB